MCFFLFHFFKLFVLGGQEVGPSMTLPTNIHTPQQPGKYIYHNLYSINA